MGEYMNIVNIFMDVYSHAMSPAHPRVPFG